MLYDVTLPVSPTLARWPGDPPVEAAHLGGEIRVSRWTLGSHAGTHVDAPTHFSAGDATVDTLDPAVLIGPCRVFDLPAVDRITADTLAALPWRGMARVLFRTRNSRQWVDDPAVFDDTFVGLSLDAAEALVAGGVRLIGVDGLSVEPFGGDGSVHRCLLGAGVVLVEGLALAAVPAGDYTLLCAPLKLAGADGAPARVFVASGTTLQDAVG
jgi:arylformamidase